MQSALSSWARAVTVSYSVLAHSEHPKESSVSTGDRGWGKMCSSPSPSFHGHDHRPCCSSRWGQLTRSRLSPSSPGWMRGHWRQLEELWPQLDWLRCSGSDTANQVPSLLSLFDFLRKFFSKAFLLYQTIRIVFCRELFRSGLHCGQIRTPCSYGCAVSSGERK